MGELISYESFLARKMHKGVNQYLDEEVSYRDLMDDPDAIEKLLRDAFMKKTS